MKECRDLFFLLKENITNFLDLITPEKLKICKKDALLMHPGPMNRGVEIDTKLADDINVSLSERTS